MVYIVSSLSFLWSSRHEVLPHLESAVLKFSRRRQWRDLVDVSSPLGCLCKLWHDLFNHLKSSVLQLIRSWSRKYLINVSSPLGYSGPRGVIHLKFGNATVEPIAVGAVSGQRFNLGSSILLTLSVLLSTFVMLDMSCLLIQSWYCCSLANDRRDSINSIWSAL